MKTLEEIKTLLMKHREDLKTRYGVREIGIFGSYVRGKAGEESDLDILVDFENPLSLLRIVALEHELQDLLGVKVDLVPKKNVRKELEKEILNYVVFL
ncbi:MAG: nucleotidyltransferase family protein [Atribacterota bacterium]